MTGRTEPTAAGDLYVLRVRAGLGRDLDGLVVPAFGAHVAEHRLPSVSTARQGMALEAAYRVRLSREASAADLVKAVNRIEGVQSVELEAAPEPRETI